MASLILWNIKQVVLKNFGDQKVLFTIEFHWNDKRNTDTASEIEYFPIVCE